MPTISHRAAPALPLAVLLAFAALPAAADRALTVDDFFAVKNVGSPQISPDGKPRPGSRLAS